MIVRLLPFQGAWGMCIVSKAKVRTSQKKEEEKGEDNNKGEIFEAV